MVEGGEGPVIIKNQLKVPPSTWVADVLEFTRAMGLPEGEDITWDENLENLRLDLLREEFNEYWHASTEVEMLDALVDLIYIAIGTAVTFGWDIETAWKRVHTSNMAKLGPDGKPILNAAGKVMKPEGWVAPDLSDLV